MPRMRLIRLLICLFLAMSAWSSEPEPTVNYLAAYANTQLGVTQGQINARPVDTTTPAPPLGYMEYLPPGYNANDPTTLWPIIMFISGAGEEGNGTNAAPGVQLYTNMTRHGPFYQMLTYGWDFPAIVVAVQQPSLWNNATILLPEFEYMKKAYHVDTNRMYLTGLCDGAVGVLNFAAQHPGYLAGIMPIEEGDSPTTNEAAGIKNTPMWTVHCWNDPIAARPCTIAWVDQSQQADTGTSNCMALYPGYANEIYHEDASADAVTGNPIYPFGAITSIGNCTLTQGSTWIAFGNGTTFGSDLFNTWGGTDQKPYCQLTMGNVTSPNSWAKAGLMMRDTVVPATSPASTSAGAMQVLMCMLPDNQVSMQWRNATGGGSSDTAGDPNGTTDSVKYLKLTRTGTTYNGYYGTDGINYTLLNSVNVAFAGATTLVGTAVCSHDPNNSYTQTFSSLSIDGTTPSASTLSDADIGTPSIAGSASLAGGIWTQTGCGADIWNNADQFNFNSESVTGDQTLIVKVGSNYPPYVVSLGKSNGVYLTHPWTGATTSTQTINICVPQGNNDTAYFTPSTSTWNWQPGQNWDTTQLCKRIFTMDWFQDHTAGWQITYNTANCWNWLLSQSLNPVITAAPLATTVSDGQSATFTVAALGTPPLTYQWTVNAVPVSGATGTTFSTGATPYAQSGELIAVIVGSPSGTTTSPAVALTVTPIAPVITLQPQSISVPSGSTATFSVAAVGTVPQTYQWSDNGVPISGATAASYTTPPLVLAASGSVFTVLVTNAAGSIGSNGLATLTVTPGAPVITTQPQSLTVNLGQTATFSVVASGVGLSYQWYLNTVLISGATGASYTTPATQSTDNGSSFTVVVGNTGGSVSSTAAILSVNINTVTPTDFGDHQVIQRTIGMTSGLVTITGTYGGTPDHIQAQVDTFGLGAVVVPWTTITTVLSGGVFSGSLTVPQGGWYQILVQSCNASGTVLASRNGVAKWGVGVDILCIGQSNMEGYGDNVYTTADDSVGLLYGGTTWMHMADPWISGGKASCGPAVGNTVSEALGIPVGLLPSAAGTNYIVPPPNSSGDNVYSYRNPANPTDPATIYGQALAAVQTAGGCEFVLISQGANEAENAANWPTIISSATYQSYFQQMVGNFQGDLPNGAKVKFAFSQLGRKLDGGVLDTGYDNIRAAHRQLDNGVNELLACSTMDFPIVDGISHYGGVSQAAHGRRLGRTLLYTLGLQTTYGGPRLGTAQFLDGTYTDIRVAITQRGGTDFIPTSGIIGFVVTDTTGPHTVTGTRISGSIIDLVGTAPFVPPATFTYLEGKNPAGPLGLFADNQADPMPLLTETEPLTVTAPTLIAPTITTQPASLTVAPGAAATFTVVASGSAPLTYQWLRGTVAISGATSASYTLASPQLTDSGASLTVTVTNGAGSVTSTPAILTVLVPSEPSLAINGWTNIPGVLEGHVHTYPVNTTTPAPPYGYVDYTPLGYSATNTTVKWPVIIYLPNTTEAGDGTDTAANGHQLTSNMEKYGPLAQVIGQNWDFPAIIICPQVTTNWAKASNIKNVVNYVEAHYQVDTTRIFMTGDLEGASGTLRYAVAYPADLAGILTIEANTAVTTAQATTIAGLPMWAVHSFADLTCARAISINWMDDLAVANFGGTSDSMNTYPGFNADRNHFATDCSAGNVPLNPNGDTVVIPGATLTHGSRSVAFPAGYTYGSGIFYLWCTSNGANFSRATISGDPTVYNCTQGFANALTLATGYVGTTSPATLTIQTPVGYTATGYRTSTGAWAWNRNEVWQQTQPDTLELTLYPNQAPAPGWVATWGNVACWDWLISWVK